MYKGATTKVCEMEDRPFEVQQVRRRDQPLCMPGPYLNYVTNLAALLPNVAGSDPRNKSGSLENRHAGVTMIAFEKDSKPKIRDFADVKDFKEHFDE